MKNNFTEDTVEQARLGWLEELGDISLPKLISGEIDVSNLRT